MEHAAVWRQLSEERSVDPTVGAIWEAGRTNYRRDLDREDRHGERQGLAETYGEPMLCRPSTVLPTQRRPKMAVNCAKRSDRRVSSSNRASFAFLP